MRRRRYPRLLFKLAVLVLFIAAARSCTSREKDNGGSRAARIDRELAPVSATASREGIAAVVLIDVSGSMDDDVKDADGGSQPKIEVARRAALDLVRQFDRYAKAHPDETVLLGIYEFSERSGEPSTRAVVALEAPDPAGAERVLSLLKADGGTPIGEAMIAGKRALDRVGLSRRHLLVVTDGENTDGHRPGDVMAALGRRPEAERPSVYFVAFDIEARRFNTVRDSGGLVLAAANARELNDTLDSLLSGKILVEGPQ